MDDLCLSIRTFRQITNQDAKGPFEKWIDDLPELLETAEECVINQLSEILLEELEAGLGKNKVRDMIRTGGDIIETSPLTQSHFIFVYGILDLIQQHVETVDSVKINDKICKLSIHVVQQSPSSFLRCKGFEVLAVMSSKLGVGQMPFQMVNQLLETNIWPHSIREKVGYQWEVMRLRVIDVEQFLTELRSKSPNLVALDAWTIQVQFSMIWSDFRRMTHLQAPQDAPLTISYLCRLSKKS